MAALLSTTVGGGRGRSPSEPGRPKGGCYQLMLVDSVATVQPPVAVRCVDDADVDACLSSAASAFRERMARAGTARIRRRGGGRDLLGPGGPRDSRGGAVMPPAALPGRPSAGPGAARDPCVPPGAALARGCRGRRRRGSPGQRGLSRPDGGRHAGTGRAGPLVLDSFRPAPPHVTPLRLSPTRPPV